MGWILSAFVLGYALFQIPGGWLGDRFGPRGVLTAAILWWSALTAATGLVPHLPLRNWIGLVWTFLFIRFLIGMGEAAAFPNSNKMVAFWVGDDRRGVANSMFLMGIGIGGTVTPLLITRIMQRWGWPMSFYISGAMGIILAIIWNGYATNRPEQHRRVNSEELQIIRARVLPVRSSSVTATPPPLNPPWKKLLSNTSTWGLMFSYFCEGYPNYIFYTWFFLYLVRARGMTVKQGGIWGAAPFLTVMVMAPTGRLVFRSRRRQVRQAPGTTADRMFGYDVLGRAADPRCAYHRQPSCRRPPIRRNGVQSIRHLNLVGGLQRPDAKLLRVTFRHDEYVGKYRRLCRTHSHRCHCHSTGLDSSSGFCRRHHFHRRSPLDSR